MIGRVQEREPDRDALRGGSQHREPDEGFSHCQGIMSFALGPDERRLGDWDDVAIDTLPPTPKVGIDAADCRVEAICLVIVVRQPGDRGAAEEGRMAGGLGGAIAFDSLTGGPNGPTRVRELERERQATCQKHDANVTRPITYILLVPWLI